MPTEELFSVLGMATCCPQTPSHACYAARALTAAPRLHEGEGGQRAK